MLRRAAGLAWCGHGGSARQANLKQGLPVALGRFSGCCSLQLNSRAGACASVLPAASPAPQHVIIPIRDDTCLVHQLDLRQECKSATPGKTLPALRRAWHCAWFLSSSTRTVLLAWTRTDGKYLALTRIEETTLTRQLVGLKFSLKNMGCKIIFLTAFLAERARDAVAA